MREHHWPPDIIGGFYVDSVDYEGIEFWYDDIVNVNAEIKALTDKAKKKK